MLHVVGIVVVAKLAVVPEPHHQIVGVLDFVGGGDAGADRAESVERLAEPAGVRKSRPGLAALFARRDVDHRCVAEHGALPVLGLDHLRRAAQHQSQFGLVHENPRHGVFRQHDGVAGADDGVRIFHEHVERPRFALGMFPVIGDAGENLARTRQRRPQPHLRERRRVIVARHLLESRPQSVEIVDDALHGELRRVAFFHRRRDIDNAAIGEHAGQNFGAGRRLEQNKLHEGLPGNFFSIQHRCIDAASRVE